MESTGKRKREQKDTDGDGDFSCNNKKKQSAGGIDVLPDDVLVNILSRLSIKEAVRASILGRRWRHLWRFFEGTLRFDYMDTPTGKPMKARKLMPLINRVVPKLHHSGYVEGVALSFRASQEFYWIAKGTSRAVNSCVYLAARKEARSFALDLSFDSLEFRYRFPSVRRLVSHPHGVASSPFRRLRTFRLAHVDIMDKTVRYLLRSCLDLEEFCIRYSLVTMYVEVFDHPSLRVLEISKCPWIKRVVISSERLVSLTYDGGRNSLKLKRAPNLCELTIREDICLSFVAQPKTCFRCSVLLEKLVLDFRLAKYRKQRFIRPADLPQMFSLKRLEVQVFIYPDCGLLFFVSLINACPHLREFRIEMSYETWADHFIVYDGYAPFLGVTAARLERTVHRELERVEISGFRGYSKEQKFVRELIGIGPSIKRVSIDTQIIDFDDPNFCPHDDDECRKLGRECKDPDPEEGISRDEAIKRAKNLVSKYFPCHIEAIVT